MIPLAKPYIGNQEIEALGSVLADGCVAGTCREVELFEQEFAKYVGSKYAVATSSCTTALHVACLILGVKTRSFVTIPAYTFPATGSAPLYCNANVELIDVNMDTWNIQPKQLPGYCKVIIPVHSFGNPCDMPTIIDIAEDENIKVIEDAACAVASTLNGKHTGTFGDIGCYSFYGIKELCTGEGGMLVTDNEEYAELARSLVDFGKTTSMPLPKFEHLGYNYRLSAIQAAIGRVQLDKLDIMHARRKYIATMYDEFIDSELEGMAWHQEKIDGAIPSYQRYSVMLDSRFNRNGVMNRMKSNHIQTSIGTFDLSSIPLYQSEHHCPISTKIFNQSISLPMYPGLSINDARQVIETLNTILNNWRP